MPHNNKVKCIVENSYVKNYIDLLKNTIFVHNSKCSTYKIRLSINYSDEPLY